MIYLKTDSTTYSINGHLIHRQGLSFYSYNIPFTAQNYAKNIGIPLREIGLNTWLSTRADIPILDIKYVSEDNSTWYRVFAVSDLGSESVPSGFYYPINYVLLCSPLRIGSSHASGIKWGHTSTSLSNSGNYTAYAKLVYYAPRYYFPLTQNLIDFAGASISLSNASGKSYGGVSYPANAPIFDEGFLITEDDVATLDITNYASGTLLLKIKYKGQNTDSTRTILKNSTFELQLDASNNLIKLIGTSTISCSFSNSGYEGGDTYFIGIKWNDTTTYLAVAKWDSTNLTFDSGTLQTTSGSFTLAFGDTYIGSTGTSQWLGDSISDFILYDYEVSDWTTAEYVFTLAPLRFNDFYIANKTAGTITFDEGSLTDEDGNDISGFCSGILLEDGTIEMTEGLSANWTAEIKDTYFP